MAFHSAIRLPNSRGAALEIDKTCKSLFFNIEQRYSLVNSDRRIKCSGLRSYFRVHMGIKIPLLGK